MSLRLKLQNHLNITDETVDSQTTQLLDGKLAAAESYVLSYLHFDATSLEDLPDDAPRALIEEVILQVAATLFENREIVGPGSLEELSWSALKLLDSLRAPAF